MSQKLSYLLHLYNVPRWSVVPRMKEQSVAEHVFGVMAIVNHIEEALVQAGHHISATHHLDALLLALDHDREEAILSDIPSPAKRALGLGSSKTDAFVENKFESPSDATCATVALADQLEAFLWIKKWGHGAQAQWVTTKMSQEVDRCRIRMQAALHAVYGDDLYPDFSESLVHHIIIAHDTEAWVIQGQRGLCNHEADTVS